jgi:short-subunit dehydrogenase involved in D-alanine esterification of teichoic acids
MNSPQRLNILVLGGQSSIGQLFLSQVAANDFNIYATCSNIELLEKKFLKHNWYELNLNSQDSIDLFLLNTQNISFDAIIALIGKTSNLEVNSSNALIFNYLETYIYKYSYLIREIVKKISTNGKENVLFMNISSRSAIFGSLDPFYSMAKSSIHALIKSLSKLYSPRIRFFNLVPGLLKNSTMFFNMHASLRADHELRAGGNLMTAEEFALFLYRFVLDNYHGSNFKNGYEVDIKVGPQYK